MLTLSTANSRTAPSTSWCARILSTELWATFGLDPGIKSLQLMRRAHPRTETTATVRNVETIMRRQSQRLPLFWLRLKVTTSVVCQCAQRSSLQLLARLVAAVTKWIILSSAATAVS